MIGAGMPDNVVTHLGASLGAGFVAVCIGSPVDVVKSRVMGDRAGRFSGVLDCFVKTAREDGLLAFYKGFIPNFARLGSWNVAMFLTLEQVRGQACACGHTCMYACTHPFLEVEGFGNPYMPAYPLQACLHGGGRMHACGAASPSAPSSQWALHAG